MCTVPVHGFIRFCFAISGFYYKSYVDTGKYLPLWVTETLTVKSIPKMIAAIERHVTGDD